jgi:hypothetical protein
MCRPFVYCIAQHCAQQAKLALAADGSRVNAGDDSAMDVDDADPYGHRYPSDDAFRRPPNLTDFAHTA